MTTTQRQQVEAPTLADLAAAQVACTEASEAAHAAQLAADQAMYDAMDVRAAQLAAEWRGAATAFIATARRLVERRCHIVEDEQMDADLRGFARRLLAVGYGQMYGGDGVARNMPPEDRARFLADLRRDVMESVEDVFA